MSYLYEIKNQRHEINFHGSFFETSSGQFGVFSSLHSTVTIPSNQSIIVCNAEMTLKKL